MSLSLPALLLILLVDGSYAPVILRLAWHSSGTFDKETGTGGRSVVKSYGQLHELIMHFSNYATMRFDPESVHSANAGLHVARQLMEQVKKEFDWISYGDLWTLGGVATVQVQYNTCL